MSKNFYDVQNLSMPVKKKLVKEFQEKSLMILVDELDKMKFARQKSDLKWTEVLKLMNHESDFKMAAIPNPPYSQDKPYAELLIRHRLKSKAVFLWIRIDLIKFYTEIIPKYKLNTLN